ncbi:MAG: ACT domain-containing protein, partial [Calditrichaeota bacterium]
LAYSEVAELAYFGANVLHTKCIRPSVEDGAELWVRNTFEPDAQGTQIVLDSQKKAGAIRAVTSIPKLSLITIEGRGMLGIPGVAARAFAATARSNTNILMISQASSEQSICFLIRKHKAAKVITTLQEEFNEELESREIDKITNIDNVVIITAVGAGMRYTPGVAGNIFSVLGENKINVIAIAQGSSECSISFVIAMEDEKNAVRCIHRLTER